MTPDEPSDFERLIKFLTAKVQQFGLAIATSDNAQLLEAMRVQVAKIAKMSEISVASLDIKSDRPIMDQLIDAAGMETEVVFVTGLEPLLLGAYDRPIRSPLIEQFNWDRDRLADKVRARVVLWLRRPAARALSVAARDLNDIVLTRFHFGHEDEAVDLKHVDLPAAVATSFATIHTTSAAPVVSSRALSEADLLDKVLEETPPDSLRWADAAMQRARLALERSDAPGARKLVTQAREIYDHLGELRGGTLARAEAARVETLAGNFEEALHILREDTLPRVASIHDDFATASIKGQVADVLFALGRLDEALQIRSEDELPVYERLGDKRSKAATLAHIAEIHIVRRQLDEALQLLRNEVLPLLEQGAGDRDRAVVFGRIAVILTSRGEFDEAVRIRRDEQLPIYERLGDQREKATTLGEIAEIFSLRGQFEEALRIWRREVLPVYSRLGDFRNQARALGKVADMLSMSNQLEESLDIHLHSELPIYERLGLEREAAMTRVKIADVYAVAGLLDKAIEILEKQRNVFGGLNMRTEANMVNAKLGKILALRLRESR